MKRAPHGLIVLLILLLPPTLVSQEAPSAEVSAVVETDSGPDRSSPRATMVSFLESMVAVAQGSPERVDEAVACLDMSRMPRALRDERGPELAYQLKEILDRTRLIDENEIPADPDSSPYVFLREASGEVVIQRTDNRLWLFSARTIESIPELYRLYEDKRVVEGVVQAPSYLSPSAMLRSAVPDGLREIGFILEHWQWLALLLLVLLGVTLDRISVLLLVGLSRRIGASGRIDIASDTLKNGLRPLGILVMAFFWRFGLTFLGLPTQIAAVLIVAIHLLGVFSAVWALYRFVDILSAVLKSWAEDTQNPYDDLLVPIFRTSAKVFIAAVGLVFVADSLDLPIRSLLAGIGLGGLAFALAAQDLVKNFFGSLTVIIERPFRIGDWVKIGDIAGSVHEVGFRSTRIRTSHDSLITVPNGRLLTASIDNLGLRRFRRLRTSISVTYDTPPEKIEAFCEGIRELIRSHPYTRKESFQVYLNEFAPSSLDILLSLYYETQEWGRELRERHRLFVDIIRLAERLGVEFAYPTQTLLMKSDDEQSAPVASDTAASVTEAESRGRVEAQNILKAFQAD